MNGGSQSQFDPHTGLRINMIRHVAPTATHESTLPLTTVPGKHVELPPSLDGDGYLAPLTSDGCGYTVERLPPIIHQYYSEWMREHFERGRTAPPAMYVATQKPHPDEHSLARLASQGKHAGHETDKWKHPGPPSQGKRAGHKADTWTHFVPRSHTGKHAG